MDGLPDYRLSVLEVYRDFASKYISNTNTLRLLLYVEHSAATLQSPLPSWIPSWDLPGSIDTVWSFSRDNLIPVPDSRDGNHHVPELINNNILKVRGVVTDKVCFTSDVFSRSTTTSKSLLGLCKAVEELIPVKHYHCSHSMAFLNALCRCRFDGDEKTWFLRKKQFVDDFENQTTATENFEFSGDVPRRRGLESLIASIARTTHGMRLILTERGYLGMAPAMAQEKDMCAILFGAQHQFLLRPGSSEHRPSYQLLGPGFIMGTNMDVGGLGDDYNKDSVVWDVEEEDIYLC